MVRTIYISILLVFLVNGVSYSEQTNDRLKTPEHITSAKTVQAEIRRRCNCRVTIEPDENRWQFLLTFHFEPYDDDINPVFYMNEQIAGGMGLKIRKVFPADDTEINICGDMVPEIKDGKLIVISSKPYPGASLGYYDAFNGRDGRKIVFQQRVWLQDRFPSEEGLYAVSYEHPWADLEGTNVRFFSNTLLVSVTSSERRDALYSFKENPELELASYQMKHPTHSEFAKYRRPLRFFDTYIQIGIPYDEVLFLMGSPDYSDRNGLHWGYETSPVGGFYIHFEDGKVSAKGFSFESS